MKHAGFELCGVYFSDHDKGEVSVATLPSSRKTGNLPTMRRASNILECMFGPTRKDSRMFGKTLAGIVLAPAAVGERSRNHSFQLAVPVAGLKLTMGGDEMGTVHIYRNGTRIQSENLRASQLFRLDIGTAGAASVDTIDAADDLWLSLQCGQWQDPGNRYGRCRCLFSRAIRLEIIPALRLGRHSLGLGVRHDFNPMLVASGAGQPQNSGCQRGRTQYGLLADRQRHALGFCLVKIKYRPE